MQTTLLLRVVRHLVSFMCGGAIGFFGVLSIIFKNAIIPCILVSFAIVFWFFKCRDRWMVASFFVGIVLGVFFAFFFLLIIYIGLKP